MTHFCTIFILGIVLFSCKPSDKVATAARADNQQLVRQYFEHFNAHNWEKMAALYNDTPDFKDPTLGTGIVRQTRPQIIEKYTALNKIFPDLHDSVINTYAAGTNHVVVEFISTGTAADGNTFRLPICTIFTIENGMITKDFTYFDNFDGSTPAQQ